MPRVYGQNKQRDRKRKQPVDTKPKYADILKKQIEPQQPVSCEPESVAFTVTQHKYTFPRPPPKRGNYSYDRWEYAYFPHLVNMYEIFCQDDLDWDPYLMHIFFRFMYSVSSGEISPFLDPLSEEQKQVYTEYLIKRKQL